MKISFIRSPWWVRYCPPYIMAYFATYMRKEGFDVDLYDLNNEFYHAADDRFKRYWDDRDYYSLWENSSFVNELISEDKFKKIINTIADSDSEILFFTTHTPNTLISMKIAEYIKRIAPEKIIVFMGHKCAKTQMAYDFIEKEYIDYVCPGEADLSILSLAQKIDERKNKGKLPESPGFLMKKERKIVDCGSPKYIEDLDELPFPDYSDFEYEIKNKMYSQPERLDILDSRGCVNACYFCYERLYWPKFRTMSAEKIFEQIKYHITQYPQIRYFYFNGLLLNGDLKVLEKFCDLIIDNDIQIKWGGQAMIRTDMTKKLFIKMKRAGCDWLYIGIESGSQKVLSSMNKNFDVQKSISILKNAKDADLKIQINIMFGFPTETEEDFMKTKEYIKKARPYIDSILASQSFFTLEKETYIRKNPEEFSITGGQHHLYWKSMDGKNDYPERFRRYEEFCRLALDIGIPETSGILMKKPDKWVLLGDYYMYDKDYGKAYDCFLRSLTEEEVSRALYMKLAVVCEHLNRIPEAVKYYKKANEIKLTQFERSEDIVFIKQKIKELGDVD